MKILQIIPNLGGGGAERFVVDLCNELSNYTEVILLTLFDERPEDIFRSELDNTVKLLSVNKKKGFDFKITGRILQIIKTEKPDIIHNHLRGINYLIPILPFVSVPVFHTIHSDAFRECPNKIMRQLRRFIFNKNKIIPITISKESSDSFQRAYKLNNNKFINNGRSIPSPTALYARTKLQIESMKKNDETRVFVHVGRIHPIKNQLNLVESFLQLIEIQDSNAILILIGRGDKKIEDKLQDIASKNESIYLIGEVKNVADYLLLADYFCLASISEGMPISLIEAMALEIIPVCTPVGGIPEMIRNIDSNLLSEDISIHGYYKALKYAYELPLLKQNKIRKQLISRFNKLYSIKSSTISHIKMYESIVSSSL